MCLQSLESQRMVLYCRIYSNVPGRTSEQKSRPSVSDFSTVVVHYQALQTRNFPLKHPIRFLQTPKEAEIYCLLKFVRTIGVYHVLCL